MGSEAREGGREGKAARNGFDQKVLDSWYGCKLSNLGKVYPDGDFQGFFIVVVASSLSVSLYSSMPHPLHLLYHQPSHRPPPHLYTTSTGTSCLPPTACHINHHRPSNHYRHLTHQLMCTGTLCCRYQHTNPNLYVFFWVKNFDIPKKKKGSFSKLLVYSKFTLNARTHTHTHIHTAVSLGLT